jgi:hypothetical protein
MKFKVLIVTGILLVSCYTDARNTSEELEYQNYVASIKAKARALKSGKEAFALSEQAFVASGLDNLVHTPFDSDEKRLSEIDSFYNNVILERYAGDVEQDYLKARLIRYAITALDLDNATSQKGKDAFVRYTRELVATDGFMDSDFLLTCLSACKGRIGKDEYNGMLKRTSFQVRFQIEQAREELALMKQDEGGPVPHLFVTMIERNEKYLEDLENLRE